MSDEMPNPDDVARNGAALFERIKTTLGDTYDQATGWKLEVSADGTVTWHVRARDQEHDGTVSFFLDEDRDELVCMTTRGGRVTYMWMRPGSDGKPRAMPFAEAPLTSPNMN